MAFTLGTRNFSTGGGGGSAIARAKKVADLYIRNNTDSAGNVTDPAVYQYVMNNILAPYADDLSVQQKIASYGNKVKELNSKAFDQDNTLGIFKQNTQNALYATGNVIRDPAKMAMMSTAALDNNVNAIDLAIAHAKETGKAYDKLEEYRKTVADMANGQRDLLNNLQSGANPQTLDGYGYFVKTNPIDGSLIGAALLPLNSAPEEVKQGMKRIDNSVGLNGSKIPVYLPATKDADGTFNAKLYGNTWTGAESDPTLTGDNTPDFSNKDAFDLQDQTKFPIKKNTLLPGSFGQALSGVKDNINQYTYYYRGQDGKVRQLDQAGLDAFKKDPMFASKLSYIPSVSPDEIKSFGSIDRLDPSLVGQWSGQMQADQDAAAARAKAQADADAANSPWTKVGGALKSAASAAGETVKQNIGGILGGPLGAAAQAAAGFFVNRVNRANKPDQAPQGTKTSYNAPDVVDKGKQIFAGGDNVA